ncbi:MAG: cupin domain-containing protein [Roseofilum sp. SBFL]|uniref:cupin domain-containing protein n=2 Tax=Roseofilum TaxID=1233426 RepID=UPI001B0D5AD5|nr:cupin domain-containing protein [Roseofilum sp. SID1]MBP0014397.1 cupin domain-containing protein [Roseofilum sp. SID3]MBP0025962.1 cupin domain-containing protein [Roseofilum sp. SID2]MBP0036134.1 cupin domain-containing protein [Roseofilum sp. SID1]MBP0040502.1 cupin domain-containing protein [Roseofilum sp. SBFL]
MQRLSPYMKKHDKRGSFCGITQANWAEVNFIETAANEVRGNHYHKETHELFFIISGEIDIEIKDINSGKCTNLSVSKGDIFIIEPYELHTFRTKTTAQWINMLSQQLDLDNPDFHKLEET